MEGVIFAPFWILGEYMMACRSVAGGLPGRPPTTKSGKLSTRPLWIQNGLVDSFSSNRHLGQQTGAPPGGTCLLTQVTVPPKLSTKIVLASFLLLSLVVGNLPGEAARDYKQKDLVVGSLPVEASHD